MYQIRKRMVFLASRKYVHYGIKVNLKILINYESIRKYRSYENQCCIRELSHERQNELKPVWDFISIENLASVFSQLFTCVHMNWGEIKLKTVWISYRLFWRKWNFISGDKISCKHYPKWNAHPFLSKYRVVLKCSRNKTSCEQNLFSRRFEISNQYEFISPLMWTYS